MSYVLIALLVAAGWFLFSRVSRARARKGLLSSGLDDWERAVLYDQVPLIRRLPFELHEALEGKIRLFLHQVEFIGCNGLEVTDEMRLSIAGQACLLIVNTDTWYSHLRTILIYPGAFKSRFREQDGFVVAEREVIRAGESWSRGPVILSWSHTEQGAENDRDGHNVVLHEFAHQIDDLSGRTDGAPVMGPGQSFEDWVRVFVPAFEKLVRDTEAGRRGLFDPYGATGQQEFFAVAVELFFEKPRELHAEEPAIYAELQKLFRLDPRSWA